MIFRKMLALALPGCTKIGQKKALPASKKTAGLQRAGRNGGHRPAGGMGVVFFGSQVCR
ncbi:hypothetical protein SAMN04488135_104181 [Pollutimonas bauzanensis]|uniref:Uncharacterized protein n=1 Tax=Pollutimonas bauzanensis TaxID=658167 RepID=A0A1M5V076_9BURK|nr:hypothetical protein SAMN04488135_104181 [Pollutimonas bauzanensis]